MLFDEDSAVRLRLVDLLTQVVARSNPGNLESISSSAVTYICSGLTGLSKVSLLLQFSIFI